MNFFLQICPSCAIDVETDIIEIGRCYKCYGYSCSSLLVEDYGKGLCCAAKKDCEERESDQMAKVRVEV